MKFLTKHGRDNVDTLVSLLSERLSSKGTAKTIDENNNESYVEVNIFSKETLESFLVLSLSEFNQAPNFSNESFESTKFVNLFADVLVEGALLMALASKALMERGREFALIDKGVTFDPAKVSDLLFDEYSALLSYHNEKLKRIKFSFGKYQSADDDCDDSESATDSNE